MPEEARQQMSATDELAPWWERTERLTWERLNFADAGLHAEVHEDPSGAPIIHTSLSLSNGQQIALRVTFPFEYPLAAPTVRVARDLIGPPHEVGGVLCLLDRPGAQWHPQRSAAALVDHNARQLLEDALINGPDAVASREELIPEPASSLHIVNASKVVMVPDPFWTSPPDDQRRGDFVLRGSGDRWVLSTADGFGACDPALLDRVLAGSDEQRGRWLALDEAPGGIHHAGTLYELARRRDPELVPSGLRGPAFGPLSWIGLTFPEQGPGRGQWRRAWRFIRLSGPDTVPPTGEDVAQTQALTRAERGLRLPELAGLERAKIVLVGVGSLGSKVAVELAKADAGRLILLDPDRYDVNNAVRHELPVWMAGIEKVRGTRITCAMANPFCEIETSCRSIGVGRAEAEDLLDHLHGAHLLIETTGNRSVTRIAQRYCRIADVPLLTASLTQGSRGGDILLLTADDCFDCFLGAQHRGEIPAPKMAEQPLVIPVGCVDPAFSGAGFDASVLAGHVARAAVQATRLTAYPPLDHNWSVVNFVDEPRWQSGAFPADPACGHAR